MGNGGDYTNAALYLAQLQQQQQGGNSSNGGNPVSRRPSGSEQFYQPIYQQLYQNNNVDTPYGASQYGKGVQYLQNPFSYAPPGVSYGSQGGMGGMSNPFTYRGGNISANSGMGYGGYGAYGTQTPGAQTGTPPPQTGGVNQYIYGPGGMFPGGNGTPTGAVKTPPRSTASSAGTSNDALLAAIQEYLGGRPVPTTGTPTGTINPPIVRPLTTKNTAPTTTPATSAPSSGGFVTGPDTPGGYQGFPSRAAYDKAVADKAAEDAAAKAKLDAYKVNPNSRFYGSLQDLSSVPRMYNETNEQLINRLKAQDMEETERAAQRAALQDNPNEFVVQQGDAGASSPTAKQAAYVGDPANGAYTFARGGITTLLRRR